MSVKFDLFGARTDEKRVSTRFAIVTVRLPVKNLASAAPDVTKLTYAPVCETGAMILC